MAIIESTIRLRDRFSSTLQRMSGGLSNAISNMHRFANSQQIVNQRTNLAGSGVNRLTQSLGGLSAAYASLASAKSLVAMGDAYIGNTARIDLMNDGLQTTAELQNKIYQASQRSLTDYNKMTSVVAKLGITAKHAFNNNDEMIAFAELVNKQFTISGASPSERSNAMYQLTQAMASGRLQGDEFRSILENAPLLAQTIAESMGQPFEKMKELSAEGKITAQVIKNALFKTAKETTDRFKNMPMQFGDLWVQASNKIQRGLEPVYIKLRQMWNNPDVQSFFDMFANGFVIGVRAIIKMIEVTSTLVSWLSKIAPVIATVLAPLALYKAGLIAVWTWTKLVGIASLVWTTISSAIGIARIALLSFRNATLAASAATLMFNAAWLANPITWIVFGIVAAIGVLIGVVYYLAGSFEEASGRIMGAVYTAGAFIRNIFVGVLNLLASYIDRFVNIGISIIEFGVNVWKDGFEGFGGACKNILGNIISWFLQLGKVVTTIVDAIFGTNWTGGLSSLQDELISWGKNDKAITLKRNIVSSSFEEAGMTRLNYGDAYNSGHKFGSDLATGIKEKLGFGNITDATGHDLGNIGTAMKNATNPVLDQLKKIADNTKSSAVTLTRNNEDMSYLRQLAERDAINKYTSNSVNVNMTNNNKVNSKLDLDKVVDYLGEKVYDTMLSTAEGVHI